MNNLHLALLGEIMVKKGIQHVVVSPGSRNAPAIIRFNRIQGLRLYSIVDERSAAFYALGMALETGETVALLCTSGSAGLNYAPAIAEAYYQQLPLLVITADRPEEWIDQGDGQTIRQTHMFANIIRKSFQLFEFSDNPDEIAFFARLVAEAIDRTQYPVSGSVHLNVPVREPLYDINTHPPFQKVSLPAIAQTVNQISPETMATLANRWNDSLAKLILVGQLPVNNNLSKQLRRLAADGSVVVMVESTSNLKNEDFVGCIDTVIEGLNPETEAALCPEILVTLGGAIVSKRIKTLLRKINPAHHWHVSPDVEGFHVDTFRSLSLTLPVDSPGFLDQLAGLSLLTKSTFAANWKQRMKERLQKHSIFLKSAPFSDIKAYELIFNQLPENGILFLGNSTPVRYGQLFNELNGYPIQSNRGTSGIDGCVSTAAGTAMLCDQTVMVITGDISFFYDSNALWNKALPANLKIIMINNGGGNIFRVIPGPDQFEELGPYIETAHQLTGEDLARGFGLNYLKANDEPELNQALKQMHHYDNRAILLEIVTPNKLSAQVLKDYFKFIAS